ncbi:hypothetical protein [Sulfobacillus harzensis]|uniref:Uncharacterized protein n=1 Tax=Sulfobacillus harzensis TaxID=2729629 RepID=A0A7Y0L835_9FIRM|nr:hypothetical protein [Sulfobacillus harzensis]NMP24748.1 hypothetical protein [Sulfobacillus harzensis]
MTCDFCDKPVPSDALTIAVYPFAYATVPDSIAYCSRACEAHAESGDWRPVWCDACGREIALHDDAYDLRDARAPQFTVDAADNPRCRRCAGIPADAAMAHPLR